jgi:hypothetical protein
LSPITFELIEHCKTTATTQKHETHFTSPIVKSDIVPSYYFIDFRQYFGSDTHFPGQSEITAQQQQKHKNNNTIFSSSYRLMI